MHRHRQLQSPPPPIVRDLRAYQEAVLLADAVHEATGSFTRVNSRRHAEQMRASAESVYANIAEGFGRPTMADRGRFLSFAWASLLELEGHAQHAANCGLLLAEHAAEIRNRARWTGRLLHALRRKTRG